MGQVENVSVETDPAFDRALKAAVQRGGSDPDAVLNALVEELEITAPLRFSISGLGSGSAGQQGLDVVFQSGTNPNAAANNAATAWLPILRGLEGNGGAYSARASLVEVNGGYILAIGVKVEQPGDGGDEPEPVTLKNIAAAVDPAKTYYTDGKFSKSDLTVTASYSNGTTKTLKEDEYKLTISGAEVTTSYTFNSVGNQTFTIEYGGETTTVTVNVVQSEVASIEVTKKPSKTTYTAGDTFSPAGMEVTVTYNSGKTETIENITTNGDSGVTWEPTEALTIDNQSVTIFYQGQEATVKITVNPATLKDIEVSWPTRTYYVGEKLSKTDVTVKAKYSNDVQSQVSDFQLTIQDPGDSATTEEITDNKPYTFTTAGEYTLTVTYKNQTQTTTITVADKGYTVSEDGKTYYVSNENGLLAWNEAAQSDYTLNCTLTENISLTGKEWTPVGNSGQTYNGTFDGQGHTITGLNISSPSEAVALFHNIGGGGKVMNLQLKDVTYKGSTAMGGIAHGNNGTITACSVMGTLKNTTNNGAVGGIAAINYGTITACWFNGTITGGSNVGGIAVFNLKAGSYDGKITACYWSGDGISDGVWGGDDTSGTTKVDDSTVTWQTAVDGMNEALTDNGYQWKLGTDGLPVLQKKQ